MALAEVVVCAVGRVVTLPAVEITAQATALLVLVMLSAAEDNGWESPLFSGAQEQPPGGPAASATVSCMFSWRWEGIAGRGVDGGIFKACVRAKLFTVVGVKLCKIMTNFSNLISALLLVVDAGFGLHLFTSCFSCRSE